MSNLNAKCTEPLRYMQWVLLERVLREIEEFVEMELILERGEIENRAEIT